VGPLLAIPGGRITVHGEGLLAADGTAPRVTVGDVPAHVVAASQSGVTSVVPPSSPGGVLPLRLSSVPGGSILLRVGTVLATGVHQVDNPALDRRGRMYLTYSGSRGEQTPVSVFRVGVPGLREAFVTGITNATALAVGPDDRLYVSSRFEGTVYRIEEDGRPEVLAANLGVACGLAFTKDGSLLVGDRSGTIFKVRPGGDPIVYATLPPSIAAFHLALDADGTLFVSGPTLAPRDKIYRVTPSGDVHVAHEGFGRPQGLAVGPDGCLYVVEALAGASGIYRLRDDSPPELVVSGPDLIGLAFRGDGGLVVTTTDTVYDVDSPASER
jgi:hypothetical protein